MTQAVVVAITGFFLSIERDRARVIRQWTITRGAYVAVIDECPCGLHGVLSSKFRSLRRSGKRTNCLCRSETCRNNPERKGVCHGWHQPRVDAMVAEIERPKAWKIAPVGVARVAPCAMAGMHGYRWKDVYNGQ